MPATSARQVGPSGPRRLKSGRDGFVLPRGTLRPATSPTSPTPPAHRVTLTGPGGDPNARALTRPGQFDVVDSAIARRSSLSLGIAALVSWAVSCSWLIGIGYDRGSDRRGR